VLLANVSSPAPGLCRTRADEIAYAADRTRRADGTPRDSRPGGDEHELGE
jgi:hypothetical protein